MVIGDVVAHLKQQKFTVLLDAHLLSADLPDSSNAVRHSISIASAWISLHSAYDVMTTPLTTRIIQMHQISHLLPQNWVVRSPPYFAHGILWMTPKTLKIVFET